MHLHRPPTELFQKTTYHNYDRPIYNFLLLKGFSAQSPLKEGIMWDVSVKMYWISIMPAGMEYGCVFCIVHMLPTCSLLL